MQNEKYDIDRLFRSALQTAEEEVPSRVWDAVSARLDARALAARRKMRRTWRSMGIGVGLAAALAAGAFLLRDRDNSTYPHIDVDRTASVQKDPVFTNDETTDLSLLTGTPDGRLSDATDRGISGRVPADRIPQAVTERPTGAEPASDGDVPPAGIASDAESGLPSDDGTIRADAVASPAEDTTSPAAGPSSVAGNAGSPVTGRKDGGQTQDRNPREAATPRGGIDPFAQMAWEDARKAKAARPALVIDGDLATNGDADALSWSSRRYAQSRIAPQTTTVSQSSRESTYAVPVTVGAGIRIPLAARLSLGTGVHYSLLQRTFTGTYTEVADGDIVRKSNGDILHSLHYVGVPLNLYYDLFRTGNIGMYVYGGGTAEKLVRNRYKIPGEGDDIFFNGDTKGFQFSAAGGLGVQFQLSPHLGFFIDPGFRYWFNSSQPVSIRTQQPLQFSLDLGLRFDL